MIVQHNPDMLRDYAVDLALAGVAAALAGSGRVVAKTVAPKSLKNFDLMTYEPAAAGAKPRAVKPIDLATFDARDYVPKTLPAKPGSRLHV
jgi:predicted nicotinamide N-methyase